jgi:Mg2+ and Co2+ transporter CorA
MHDSTFLKRPVPVAAPGPWHRLLLLSTFVLNDVAMGLLGILALGTATMPLLFDLTDRQAAMLDQLEWLVVFAFSADYLVHFLLAEKKRDYLRNGWRLLDLGVIAACALTLLPSVTDSLRYALVLRALRILRAFSFGMRAGAGFMPRHPTDGAPAIPVVPHAFVVRRQESWKADPVDWSRFLAQASAGSSEWLDAFDLAPEHVEELGRAVGVPATILGISRAAHTNPRLRVIGGKLIASLALPLVRAGEAPEVERVSISLVVAEGRILLTLASRECDLRQRMARSMDQTAKISLAALGIEAYFRTVLEQNEDVLASLEMHIRSMEDMPIAREGEGFFRVAFRMRRHFSHIKADLWRLSGILDAIEAERVQVPERGDGQDRVFTALSDQADYLYETASNLQEELISLIELHLNTVSFEMNRFMRLLAVVSVLAVVPATVGGLLGMNILGTPWHVTLEQVSYLVGLVVLGILYVFFARGYLK